jgi:hypothetical protein
LAAFKKFSINTIVALHYPPSSINKFYYPSLKNYLKSLFCGLLRGQLFESKTHGKTLLETFMRGETYDPFA